MVWCGAPTVSTSPPFYRSLGIGTRTVWCVCAPSLTYCNQTVGPTVLHHSEKLLVARSRSRSACHHSDSDSDLEIDCGDFYIYVLLFFTVLLRKKKKHEIIGLIIVCSAGIEKDKKAIYMRIIVSQQRNGFWWFTVRRFSVHRDCKRVRCSFLKAIAELNLWSWWNGRVFFLTELRVGGWRICLVKIIVQFK